MEGSDVENFVLAFSRLTTTSRNDWTSRFREHVGVNVPGVTVAFYHGMCLGDLRAAISAFCQHYSNQQELPEMSAVAKWNPVTDGVMTLKPSTSFPIQWQVKNTGLYPWPKGTHLTLANAFEDHLPHPEIFKILEQLIPHYQKTITVRMTSPSQTGTYTARWKMVAPCGTYCGEDLFVNIRVVDSVDVLADQMAAALFFVPDY